MFTATRLTLLSLAGLLGLLALPTPALDLLAEPTDGLLWWETAGTAMAAATVIQLTVAAYCLYVLMVSTTVLIAGWCRLASLQRVALRYALPSLRRSLCAGVAIGVLSVTSAHAAETGQLDLTDLGPATTTDQHRPTMVLYDLGPAETVAVSTEEEPVVTDQPTDQPDRVGDPLATWTVTPGDSLWTIARQVLVANQQLEPSTTEIATYWSAVIAANTDRVTNPDLIFPGQELVLPALAFTTEDTGNAEDPEITPEGV